MAEQRQHNRRRQIDLVREPIFPALTRLAMPIMASAFLATAYNLTDMAWVGTLGSDAVASVGVGGMYTWLSAGVILLARMGGQVMLGQSLGAGDREKAGCYARAAVHLGILLGLLYGTVCLTFTPHLVGYFHLSGAAVIRDAECYIRITGGLVIFFFMTFLLTGLFTAQGDSATPFRANLMGLLLNMTLDPLMIRGIGPFPSLGVTGAAAATVFSQSVVMMLLIFHLLSPAGAGNVLRSGRGGLHPEEMSVYADIIRIGLPTSAQNMIYTGISFVLTQLAAGYGDLALAVLRMGNQIESVSWNISDGFAASINAFTAQNYGARQRDRIRKGYDIAFRLLGSWGLFVTAMFLLFPEQISGIFFHEAEAIRVSAGYLRIVGLCEAFMCIESMTVGALSGLGKTRLCSAVSIILTGARIPYAWILCRTSLGLTGIWWALSISSISKGIVFFSVMRMMLAKDDKAFFPPEKDAEKPRKRDAGKTPEKELGGQSGKTPGKTSGKTPGKTPEKTPGKTPEKTPEKGKWSKNMWFQDLWTHFRRKFDLI